MNTTNSISNTQSMVYPVASEFSNGEYINQNSSSNDTFLKGDCMNNTTDVNSLTTGSTVCLNQEGCSQSNEF